MPLWSNRVIDLQHILLIVVGLNGVYFVSLSDSYMYNINNLILVMITAQDFSQTD